MTWKAWSTSGLALDLSSLVLSCDLNGLTQSKIFNTQLSTRNNCDLQVFFVLYLSFGDNGHIGSP